MPTAPDTLEIIRYDAHERRRDECLSRIQHAVIRGPTRCQSRHGERCRRLASAIRHSFATPATSSEPCLAKAVRCSGRSAMTFDVNRGLHTTVSDVRRPVANASDSGRWTAVSRRRRTSATLSPTRLHA